MSRSMNTEKGKGVVNSAISHSGGTECLSEIFTVGTI